jgi:hypothetical protein
MNKNRFIPKITASFALISILFVASCGGGSSDSDSSSSDPSVVGTWLWTETYDKATEQWSTAAVTDSGDDVLNYVFTSDRLTFSLTSSEINCEFTGPYTLDSNNTMIWTLDSSSCPNYITGDVYGGELEFEDDNTLFMEDDEERLKLIRQ